MSKRQSQLFGRVKRKNSKPEFELTEQHVPPPPPQKSRSFSDMKKDTLKKIKQEEEEQKEVAKQIEQEVQAYNAHFGYYRSQYSYGFRVSTDTQGNFYVRNNIQSNSNFERFFETENVNFNHYLSQQRSDLFYHLDSQKTGGTSDYDDQSGNFSATKFKRMYYQMDREFRQYFRVQDKEYRAFLDSLDEKQVFQEYEKYNALFYLDGKMDNYQFPRNEVYFIAYIPSDAGKSTLFRDFKHYYFDLDHLLSVGKKKHKKFLFLSWLSETLNDYRYIHNFWKHQIYLNRKLLRGKILLAHNPAEVPENMRKQSYQLKMMVQRPSLSSYRYHFDYQLLDSYFTDVQKVFLSYQDLHFFLYNTAVHLGYNPIKFR